MAGSLREASTLILASRTEGAKHGYALTKDIESFGRGGGHTLLSATRERWSRTASCRVRDLMDPSVLVPAAPGCARGADRPARR